MPRDRITAAVIEKLISRLNEKREESGVPSAISLEHYQPGDWARTYKLYVSTDEFGRQPIGGLDTYMTARECYLVVRTMLAVYYGDDNV